MTVDSAGWSKIQNANRKKLKLQTLKPQTSKFYGTFTVLKISEMIVSPVTFSASAS
jgi:hypothetical protein